MTQLHFRLALHRQRETSGSNLLVSQTSEGGRFPQQVRVAGFTNKWGWPVSPTRESGRFNQQVRVTGFPNKWEWPVSPTSEGDRFPQQGRVAGLTNKWGWPVSPTSESGRFKQQVRVAGIHNKWGWPVSPQPSVIPISALLCSAKHSFPAQTNLCFLPPPFSISFLEEACWAWEIYKMSLHQLYFMLFLHHVCLCICYISIIFRLSLNFLLIFENAFFYLYIYDLLSVNNLWHVFIKVYVIRQLSLLR